MKPRPHPTSPDKGDGRAHASRRPASLPPDVQEALRADAIPRDEQAALAEIWHLSAHLPQAEPPPETFHRMGTAIQAALEAELDRDAAPPRTLRRVHNRRWYGAVGIAASLLVLCSLGWWWWQQPLTYVAASGETPTVTLADGSQVQLNSGATLHYPRRFDGGSRVVTLEGEAFFEVEEGRTPFVVETFDASVTVLGTSFNVRAWGDEPLAATHVTVATGVVRLASRAAEASGVTLRPGQASQTGAAMTVAPADVAQTMAWRSGRMVFANRPLHQVLHDLERRFGVSVSTEDAALAEDSITLVLNRPASVEAFLEDLVAAYQGIAYEATGEGYRLYRND